MAEQSADAKQLWDKVYSQNFMTMWYPNEEILRFCARLIRKRITHDEFEVKKPVEHVLDLGCGNGRHAMYFAREGFKAAGIDVSPQAIEWARDWARREALEVDFRVGDIVQLPFDDGAFEAVVSHGVLDHVPMETARKAAAEVHRVLRPQGLFYCDLRSADDSDFGDGEEAGPNTFIAKDGFESGLVQHFFTFAEIQSLFDGLFRIIYSEISEHKMGENFQHKNSRWVLASEAI